MDSTLRELSNTATTSGSAIINASAGTTITLVTDTTTTVTIGEADGPAVYVTVYRIS